MKHLEGLTRQVVFTLFATALAVPTAVHADGLPNVESAAGFEFNFENPGARSLAMGGAFAGLADDATAAVANPAGLRILSQAEFGAEIRNVRFGGEIPFAAGPPPGFPQTSDEFPLTTNSLSYASYIGKPREHSSGAVYYRKAMNYETRFSTDGLIFRQNNGRDFRFFAVDSALEVTADALGFAGAVDLLSGDGWQAMLGANLEIHNAEIKGDLTRFGFRGFTSPIAKVPADIRNVYSIDGSDTAVSWTYGLLVKGKKHSVGLVYKRGPEYRVGDDQFSFNADFATGGLALVPITGLDNDFSLKVPDILALGVAFQPTDRLTLTAELTRIQYSQITENTRIILAPGQTQSADYQLDDATEVHVGAEYVMEMGSRFVALRVGWFRDPDHRIRYVGPREPTRILFPGGEDRDHVTAGIGLVLGNGIQIDFAASQSDGLDRYLLSFVRRFGASTGP